MADDTQNSPRGWFVTGTDTGVGKSEIACALAHNLQGRCVVRKPVESGCELIDDTLIPSDAVALLDASGGHDSLDAVCPYRFKEPISPESAAILHHTNLQLSDLFDACQIESSTHNHPLIVEGAGGFLSPIAPNALNADLADALGLPVVLVVANRLGCVSHTLLTIEAIEQRHLSLERIFLNQCEPSDFDFASDLKRWVKYPIFQTDFSEKNKPWRSFRFTQINS